MPATRAGLVERPGHFRDAERRRVRRDDRARRRGAIDVGDQRQLQVDPLRRRFDDEVACRRAPRPRSAVVVSRASAGVGIGRRRLAELDGLLEARPRSAPRALRASASLTRRTAASRSRTPPPRARCRAPSCRRRARSPSVHSSHRSRTLTTQTISSIVSMRAIDLRFRSVEVRRDADAGVRPVVDDDLPSQQLVGDRARRSGTSMTTEPPRSRSSVGVFSRQPRAPAPSIRRRVSWSDRARIAGTPISATIS